jgi:exo-beta-1,3-glucanase (GH17 family)
MKTTSTQRVATVRARKAAAGLVEIRGIYAIPDLHDDLKEMIKLYVDQRTAEPKPETTRKD